MGATTAKFFADVLARDYSTSKLSKGKVNLLAILGVCSKFEEQYGQKFYAGILMMVQVKACFGKCQRIACQNIAGLLLRHQKTYDAKVEDYDGPFESAPNQYLTRITRLGCPLV
ncbi:uncharacterized protein RSE6_07139 [Rhynchosporium secalis]|uniref:Uncharacterized protein n=1 Tax=Rhynchosporium secalis TaxID=38038 RepID=A0A1E1MC46_RHYSE|nr:uncharacterized protein RSE6_07139 [Rhynchosporium secalis]